MQCALLSCSASWEMQFIHGTDGLPVPPLSPGQHSWSRHPPVVHPRRTRCPDMPGSAPTACHSPCASISVGRQRLSDAYAELCISNNGFQVPPLFSLVPFPLLWYLACILLCHTEMDCCNENNLCDHLIFTYQIQILKSFRHRANR